MRRWTLATSLLGLTLVIGAGEEPRREGSSAQFNERSFIWRDPGDVASLDFIGGPGGRENAPQPPFVFSEELPGGSTPKILVIDGRRARWQVKWGEEAKPQAFASRMLWAVGYKSQPSYFVREGRLDSVGRVGRAEAHINRSAGNQFTDAVFELRDPAVRVAPGKNWSFVDNPFAGTPQLNGLKIMMMLLSNWDVKDSRSSDGPNTAILEVETDGGAKELHYAVTDWGATMGRWGDILSRSKWDCKGYQKQTEDFVKGLDDTGFIGFGFSGKRKEDMAHGVKPEDVKWLMAYLGRVTDAQIRDALTASGANSEEVTCYATALRSRISQLQNIAAR